ncbi:MAG: tRNA pseudouridine(55) synthase TruB, partial [Desulfobaccales bacterium]|nr:tRNA pseudouridine(55) synthase TruB [Desulfobaccales bacterium]
IHRLEVLEVALPLVTLNVTCSAGTYIRTLAADLGKALGCGAHLAALRRLAVGPFKVEAALPLNSLEEAGYEEIWARLIGLADCLPGLRRVVVEPDQAQYLRQGRPVQYLKDDLNGGERVRVLLGQDLVAVALVRAADSQTWLTPIRVFSGSQQSTVREASPLATVP